MIDAVDGLWWLFLFCGGIALGGALVYRTQHIDIPPCICQPTVCDPPLLVECPARTICPTVECVCDYPDWEATQ